MTPDYAIQIIRTCIGLSALWVLYMFWRQFRADVLRDELFAVRDRLFDHAAAGHIDFCEPAFRGRWELLNALIRFADQMSFGRVVIPAIITPTTREDMEGYVAWRKSLRGLDEPVRQYLKDLDCEITDLVISHIIQRTLPLVPVVLAMRFGRWLNVPSLMDNCRAWFSQWVPAIEAQAIDAERMRRHRRHGAAIAA